MRGPSLRLLSLIVLLASLDAKSASAAPPNIVFILCDDLGYGDVRCLNPQGKIVTPNMDRLAAGGMILTDAHSSSAVCSPTRYGVMTGRYNWRTKLQKFVLGGLSPPLIEPGRLTVPALLKQHGYATACIGKWHLGMDWVKLPGKEVSELTIETPEQVKNVDYSQPIAGGPNAVGFDYYFGISASLDMVPYCFIENDRVTQLPTQTAKYPLMFGREGGFAREGPAAPGFTCEAVLPELTRKAVQFINRQVPIGKPQPFFLYLPLNAPHTPIAPTERFRGKSGLNPYADFVMETDWAVGEVLDTLDKNDLTENTLVILTSDNGCSPQAKFPELLAKGHNPSHVFRGTKADIYDGGHHVPFIARWPAKVKPGTQSDQLVCLLDLMGTCADILGVKLPDDAGEDSVSYLPALTGAADKPLREALVHHSINGSFAIRQGRWKLQFCASSGGWSAPKPSTPAAAKLPERQLYDMTADIGETQDLASANPEVVAKLERLLGKYVDEGRSTPGKPQRNAVPVIWEKEKLN